MKLFFKKSHAHKPKKGKSSYSRLPIGLDPELVELAQKMEAQEELRKAVNLPDDVNTPEDFLEWARGKHPEDYELAEQLKRELDEKQQRN